MTCAILPDSLRSASNTYDIDKNVLKSVVKVKRIRPNSPLRSERSWLFVNFSHHHLAARPTKAIQIIKYSINLRLKETFSENSICIISSPSTKWEFQSISDESWLSEFLIRTSGANSGSGKKLCSVELRRNENYRNLTVPKHFLSLFILNFTTISE